MVNVPGMPAGFQMPEADKQPGEKQTFVYGEGNWTSPNVQLAAGETLNKEVLDKMKESLDDLEIIDVEKKPGIIIKEVFICRTVVIDFKSC